MGSITMKYIREPYGQDRDILRLYRDIAGECDSKKELEEMENLMREKTRKILKC